MGIIDRRFFLKFMAVSVGAAMALTSIDASAEGGLRGRIREKIKERVVEKLEEAPAPEANASTSDRITTAGDYYFSIPHQGLTRMYRIHVPPSYNPATPAPLIFAFHGGGGDMEYMARDEYYGLISKADQTGYVIVFPNGSSHFKSGKLATWNAGECCGGARDNNVDDIGFVKQMVANITHQMNINPDKIYATGMSNGGMMAYRIACELSGTFKAVASVTGTDNVPGCRPNNPVSVLHIHAQNDTHVLFNGGAGKDVFKDETMVTDFTSVPDTFRMWKERNSCTGQPARVLDVEGAYCDLYSSCSDGSQVKLCVTETGGHSWPGGNKPGGRKQMKKEPTSKAISANDEIWAFFGSLK